MFHALVLQLQLLILRVSKQQQSISPSLLLEDNIKARISCCCELRNAFTFKQLIENYGCPVGFKTQESTTQTITNVVQRGCTIPSVAPCDQGADQPALEQRRTPTPRPLPFSDACRAPPLPRERPASLPLSSVGTLGQLPPARSIKRYQTYIIRRKSHVCLEGVQIIIIILKKKITKELMSSIWSSPAVSSSDIDALI